MENVINHNQAANSLFLSEEDLSLIISQKSKDKNDFNRLSRCAKYIVEIQNTHGAIFDFSLVWDEFKDLTHPVTVICPKHGPFRAQFRTLRTKDSMGCPECHKEKAQQKYNSDKPLEYHKTFTFEEFINRSEEKFGTKFNYSDFTIDNVCVEFNNYKFNINPKTHLISKDGFPKTIDYELFIEIAKDSLQEEFDDYSFDKNNYVKYAVPMHLLYKGKRITMKPIDVVRSSRKSKEYFEYKEITSRYSRPEEMNKDYPSVYKNIKIRHWNELIRHFDMRTNNKYKFSMENIEEFIDECAEMGLTRNDVKRMYPKPAQYIRTHRLTELFLKLPLDNNKIKHSYDRKCGIYAYEFFINNEKYVYVGLTCDFKRRDMEHRKEVHGKTTTVYKFAGNNHIDIPEMKIVIDYEDTLSAIKDEGEVLNDYINNGWIQLNVEKTGGIGAPSHYSKDRLPIDNYNKELCQ